MDLKSRAMESDPDMTKLVRAFVAQAASNARRYSEYSEFDADIALRGGGKHYRQLAEMNAFRADLEWVRALEFLLTMEDE